MSGAPDATPLATPPTMLEAFALFRRLVVAMRPFWPHLLRGYLLGVCIAVLGLLPSLFSKAYFDSVLPNGDHSLLIALIVLSGLLTSTTTVLGALRAHFGQVVSSSMGRTVSLLFFNHVQHLPARFFAEQRVGEVMSRFQDAQVSLGTVTKTFETVLISTIHLALVPLILFTLDPTLALLCLVTIPITTTVSLTTGRILRRMALRRAEATARLSAHQFEVLSRIQMVKAMAAEEHMYAGLRRESEEVVAQDVRINAFAVSVGSVNTIIHAAGQAAFTFVAWTRVIDGELSLGAFIAFSGLVGFLVGPTSRIAELIVGFQQSAVSLGRMFEVLDRRPESSPTDVYDSARRVQRWHAAPALHIRDLSYSYVAGRPVLDRFEARLEAGTVTAMIGASGSGKSTLLRLIARIDAPTWGDIVLDGRSISAIDLRELRANVRLVDSDAGIINGTLRHNIVLGRTEWTPARLDDVLEACQLTELVGSLENGLESSVAEWGASLSAGERQRIALARALLVPAPVVLLDEPTASLDGRTEKALLRAVVRLVSSSTVLMVTHRPAAAAAADSVLHLVEGRCRSFGTHARLLAESREYAAAFGAAPAATAAEPRLPMTRDLRFGS